MPIYEYSCSKCQEHFELLLLSASEKPRCPQCGSEDLSKLISAFAFASKKARPSCPASGNAGGCPGSLGGHSPCGGCPL